MARRAPTLKTPATELPETPLPGPRFDFASLPIFPPPPAAPKESLGPARPLEAGPRKWLEASAGPLPDLWLHDTPQAHRLVGGFNAHAAAYGSHLATRPGGFSGAEGRRRLAHEVAHTLQQSNPELPRADNGTAERDARDFAGDVTAGRPARVRVSAPAAWAFDAKTLQPGDVVSHLKVLTESGKVRVTMTPSGDVFEFTLERNTLSPGTYEGFLNKGVPSVRIEGDKEQSPVLYFVGTKDSPNPQSLKFPASFTVTISDGSMDTPVPALGGPGTTEGGSAVGAPKEGALGGVPPAAPPPSPDVKTPVIQVSDLNQIEELKQKGLLPATSADQLQSKLERREPLSFEEALGLLEAMNRVMLPPSGKDREEGPADLAQQDNWLTWAKFLQENRDRISGKSKTSGEGMSVAEMKELLDKYKQYVGVPDAPSQDTKKKEFNPELSKSWNSLEPWEKQFWSEYKKYYPPDEGSTREDLHLTRDDLFRIALNRSIQYMPSGAGEAAEELFTDPIFISTTIIAVGGYLGLWTVPEPTSKGVAVVITVALLSVFSYSEIKSVASAWTALREEAAKARTMEELDTAAEPFGKAMGGTGLRVLVTLATMFGGSALNKGVGGKPLGGGRGGPGGLMPEPVGGPANVLPSEGMVIKVLKDGTIVILSTAPVLMSSMGGGGGGGGKGSGTPSTGKQGQPPDKEPTPAEKPAAPKAAVPAGKAPEAGKTPATPKTGRPKLNELGLSAAEEAAVNNTVQMVKAGQRPPDTSPAARNWGEEFRNHPRNGRTTTDLPKRPPGYYKEYTIMLPGATERGTWRLIVGKGGELFLTKSHYVPTPGQKPFIQFDF